MLAGEPVSLVTTSTRASGVIASALELLGACVDSAPRASARALLLSFEAAARLDGGEIEALRNHADRTSVFMFFSEARPDPRLAVEALRRITGVAARVGDPVPIDRFVFAAEPELWPFGGSALAEAERRSAPALDAAASGFVPLISSSQGDVFARLEHHRSRIYVSLVPPPSDSDPLLLKREFHAKRFMGLLPLLVFVREALGRSAWRTPEPVASFLVDDPNLRDFRYGFLDLRSIVPELRARQLHLAIAMIPLDYRKTRPEVAAFVRQNASNISLVLHGVDHRKREFARPVTPQQAERVLADGLARMAAHRRATGIEHARAITFPHGACNETWLTAMRNAGFDAAVVSRALPFRHEEVGEPHYELHPAETSFLGFPVVNRYPADEAKEELLFKAWLGKPLIPYTHHGFFRDGVGRMLEIAEFLDRRVAPRWQDIGSILRSNYQIRETSRGRVVRAFSNRIAVPAQPIPKSVFKPARAVLDDERVDVDGREVDVEHVPGVGLVVTDLPATQANVMDIAFRPARSLKPPGDLRVSPASRLRRLATELRDRASVRFAH